MDLYNRKWVIPYKNHSYTVYSILCSCIIFLFYFRGGCGGPTRCIYQPPTVTWPFWPVMKNLLCGDWLATLGDHFWCPEVRKRISRGPPWRPGYYLRGGGPCFVPAAPPSGTPSRQILRMEPFQLLRDPFGTLWDPFLK